MKSSCTLILLLSLCFSAVAQIPFPSSNTVWTQRNGAGEAPPGYSVIGLLSEDVTIGANSYHKVFLSTNNAILEPSEYIGGLREAAGGKVFFYDLASASERLIYDFSLAIGDTVFDPANNTPTGTVQLIDYVTIAGVPHKRLQFRQLMSTAIWAGGAWIEGIGNSGLGGLLGSPLMQPTCDCGVNTICVANSGTSEYQNPSYVSIDCGAVLKSEYIAHENKTVNLYPNPVTYVSQLELNTSESYVSFSITDLLGRTVIRQQIDGVHNVPLKRADLLPGNYIYHVVTPEGNRISGRFTVE
jgi:hypothetical protein